MVKSELKHGSKVNAAQIYDGQKKTANFTQSRPSAIQSVGRRTFTPPTLQDHRKQCVCGLERCPEEETY